jgi:hypothetical protein
MDLHKRSIATGSRPSSLSGLLDYRQTSAKRQREEGVCLRRVRAGRMKRTFRNLETTHFPNPQSIRDVVG